MAKSCKEILTFKPTATTGTYIIAPSGTPFTVQCDMTSNGGGWTLVFYSNSDNVARTSIVNSDWNSGPTVNFSRLYSMRNIKGTDGKYEFWIRDSSTVGRHMIFKQTNAYNQNPVGNGFVMTGGNLSYTSWTNGSTWYGLATGNFGNAQMQASCTLSNAYEGSSWTFCLQDQFSGNYNTGPWYYNGAYDSGSQQWVQIWQR